MTYLLLALAVTSHFPTPKSSLRTGWRLAREPGTHLSPVTPQVVAPGGTLAHKPGLCWLSWLWNHLPGDAKTGVGLQLFVFNSVQDSQGHTHTHRNKNPSLSSPQLVAMVTGRPGTGGQESQEGQYPPALTLSHITVSIHWWTFISSSPGWRQSFLGFPNTLPACAPAHLPTTGNSLPSLSIQARLPPS